MALRRLWPVLGAIVIAVVVVSVMIPFLFLIPLAIWLAVRWALVVPVVVLEGLGPLAAIRRSSRLVRGDWLKVGSLTIVSAGITLALGPLIGTALIVLTNMPLGLLNLIAGVVYMLTMPFIALTTMYVYLDTRVGEELRGAARSERAAGPDRAVGDVNVSHPADVRSPDLTPFG